MSTEQECLTTVERRSESRPDCPVAHEFMDRLARAAPSLPSAGSGLFNAYGRVYVDCGHHLELAGIECDSPYQVPVLLECQHILARAVIDEMATEGTLFYLANNNHSGLLRHDAPTWGAHENHMAERDPGSLSLCMLPFLVTRIYGGAGGLRFPDGDLVAGVRHEFMELATGGGTTSDRAIHSTARDESLMARNSGLCRYHLILGDGHRSQFNLALQFGTTALAIKCAIHDEALPRELERTGLPLDGNWVATLRRFNRLAAPGEPPRVDPRVIDVQRIYLGAAHRFAATLDEPPPWIPRLLVDWEATLDALERDDYPWLGRRLDIYMKHELITGYLDGRWGQLPGNRPLFSELALLDHDYHAFARADSIFARMTEENPEHRVGGAITPGDEEEAYVPEVRTRARARARFIRQHAGSPSLAMDWGFVHSADGGRRRSLLDPLAEDYGPWRGRSVPEPPRRTRRRPFSDRARQLLTELFQNESGAENR